MRAPTIRAPGILARLADRLSASDELTFVYPMIEVLTEPDRLAGADKLGNTRGIGIPSCCVRVTRCGPRI